MPEQKDVTNIMTANIKMLNEEIQNCRRCGLSQTRTRAVPGEGHDAPKVMLVGEAPGREEDLSGRPFVGRAGKILDLALCESGLERSQVFITSVIKCRPPLNRRPTRKELDLCHPFIRSQIRILKPKVVCLMGNTALAATLNLTGVTEYRGQFLEDRYLVTYHPAAVLRNRNLMGDFVSDLTRAWRIGCELQNSV